MVISVLVGSGLALALMLSVMVGQGEITRAIMVALAVLAVGASLASLEVAVAVLVVVSFLDGFLKSADPSKLAVFVKDAFLVIALARWGWRCLLERNWAALRMRVTGPALLFIVYVLMEMFNTTTADYRIALAGARTWILWIPAAYVVYAVARSRARVERLLLLVIGMAFVTGLYGMIQYRSGFSSLNSLGTGFAFYARHFGAPGETVRAVSTFVSPGALGAAMSLSAVIALAGTAFLPGRGLKVLAAVTAAVCLVGLGASASRAPLLGLVAGGAALLLLMRRARLLLTLMLAGIVFVWLVSTFAGGEFSRRYNRQMISPVIVISRVMVPFRRGWESVWDNPLGVGVATGIGVGRGEEALGHPQLQLGAATGFVENEYARALRELGFPGFCLFLWMLGRVLAGNIGAYRRCHSAAYRAVAAACVAVTISILFQLAVGSALYLAPGGLLFWSFYAISQRLPELEAAELGYAVAYRPAGRAGAPAVPVAPVAGS
jgi:hypothetical protein